VTLSSAVASDKKKDPDEIGNRDVGKGVNFYSIEKEIALGKQLAQEVERQAKIVDDPVIAEYVNRVGQNLVRNSDAKVPFTIKVLDAEEINAFALPGGFFFVNTGVLLNADTEAELAGVMAHEIAHVTQRHIARRVRSQGRQSIATMAAILAAILIGAATGSSDAALGGISMAQGAAMQQQINFTRANESEADRVGMGFLAAAGFDPYGMPDFFETIGRRSSLEAQSRSALPEILQSHPVTSNRIAESRGRAAQYHDLKPTPESASLTGSAACLPATAVILRSPGTTSWPVSST
jgi:predicted Zn-dependent protease